MTVNRTDALKFEMAAEVLASFGEARLPAGGSSMFPCIRPGDILLIRRVAAAVKPGQVVVFERHDRLVSHRVARRTADFVITRGDRVAHPDEPVPAAAILGCVASVARGNRRFAPRSTGFGRIVSWVLQRTDFGTRAALYFARMLRP